MNERITVLLVDDHTIVRQGVRTFLELQPDIAVIGEAETGVEAVRLASEYAPDVVLMDLKLPEMDGIAATRKLVEISPRTHVIVLTSYHDDEHIFPAIRAGAISYVLKDIRPAALADVVRKAAAGEAVLHPRVARRLMQEINRSRAVADALAALTEREVEVLRLVGEGLSNAEIAARLVISEKTAKSHISNILSKLHLADRTQAAVYAWREGLMHPNATSGDLR
ncbi:MAG: response regulator transcription factor [Chloroflexi bacterium]|nr:response regulator transcription factor [Chloroflexota bacterium]